MAVQIQLTQRTQVGPGTTGVTKPPLALADRSGQIELGQSVQQLGGDLFKRFTLAKVANEKATFRGVADTEIQAYGAHVEQNPNASEEELKKELDAMMTRIKDAGGKATTGQAKRSNAIWFAENENLIKKKTHDQMVAIGTKHELTKYQINQKTNMDNLDPEAYKALKDEMVAKNVLNKEIADAQEKLDMAIMDRAMDKIEISNAVGVGFNVWKSTGDTRAALDAIEATKLPASAKQDAESQLIQRIGYREALDKVEKEKAQEVSRDELNDAMQSGTLTYPQIDASNVDEKEQKTYQTWLTNETERINSGKAIITDSSVRAALMDDTVGIMTGERTKQELLTRAIKSRYGDQNLNETDFRAVQSSINQEYATAHGKAVTNAKEIMRGILLKPDTFGIVPNAPVRNGIYADALQEFYAEVATLGDQLKPNDIIKLGAEVAANHQVSDEQAERLELETETKMKARAKGEEEEPTKSVTDQLLELQQERDRQIIKVAHPDGRTGTIPRNRVEAARKAGFRVLGPEE